MSDRRAQFFGTPIETTHLRETNIELVDWKPHTNLWSHGNDLIVITWGGENTDDRCPLK